MKGAFHSRAFTALLLAVVLCGKLLVPSGWMPVSTQGGLTIMLCSGDGPAEAWVDDAGKLHQGHKPGDGPKSSDHDGKDPCPYGALTAPVDTPAAVALAARLAPTAPVIQPLTKAIAVGHGLAAPPPPSTGPPVSA